MKLSTISHVYYIRFDENPDWTNRKHPNDPKSHSKLQNFLNKSSAVAKVCDRLATIDMDRKVAAAVPLSVGQLGPHLTLTQSLYNLHETVEEKDLGIVVTDSLSASTQCADC